VNVRAEHLTVVARRTIAAQIEPGLRYAQKRGDVALLVQIESRQAATPGTYSHSWCATRYGGCSSLPRLDLYEKSDIAPFLGIAEPGFDLGCDRPSGNHGEVFRATFTIPSS